MEKCAAKASLLEARYWPAAEDSARRPASAFSIPEMGVARKKSMTARNHMPATSTAPIFDQCGFFKEPA